MPCLLEWLDTDGFGFSLFHVYYGSLHVFFIEKIRFYIFLAGGGENTEAVRLDFFNRAVRNEHLSAGQRFAAAFFSFDHLRILGVLQRLAIAYLGGALLSLWIKPKHYLWASVVILAGYFLILLFGNGFALSADSILVKVDEALFGANHVHGAYLSDGTRLAFDPEGLLSALPCFAHVLLGMYVGNMLVKIKENA